MYGKDNSFDAASPLVPAKGLLQTYALQSVNLDISVLLQLQRGRHEDSKSLFHNVQSFVHLGLLDL